MIEKLSDKNVFRQRRNDAWTRNTSYWLSEPLRHVTDTGSYISERTRSFIGAELDHQFVILDMGCGSCWLLESLLAMELDFIYIGLDNNSKFVDAATERYADIENASFVLADLDMRVSIPQKVDLVVNAFNFFELASLDDGMNNTASWLRPGGTLFMSTIDKTYLILALSKDWDEFHENLRIYQDTPGVKFDFQKIDLGRGLSQELEYPSVLYSTQDYITAAKKAGLQFASYSEQAFTGRAIPKIYCHLEFTNS